MEEKFSQAEEPEAEKSSPFQTKRDLNSTAIAFGQFDPALLKGKNTFALGEKLKSKKIIDRLFNEGKSVSNNGFTLVSLVQPLYTFYPAQAAFSVPKRCFKRAVDRNRVKRLMREAYRHHKLAFYEKRTGRNQQLALMFIYKGKDVPTPQDTAKAMVACLDKLAKK